MLFRSINCLGVHNENFFKDLSGYRLCWELLDNGKAVRTGTVENIDAAPGQRTLIPFFPDYKSDGELLLNVRYELKEDDGLLPAGHVAAKQQFCLSDYNFQPAFDSQDPVLSPDPVITYTDNLRMAVTGQDFSVEFSLINGFMERYCVNGLEMIEEGSALKPNFPSVSKTRSPSPPTPSRSCCCQPTQNVFTET